MTNNQNFVEFMQEIIPAREENPDHTRLDGQISGGNRTIFGCFQHGGRIWKVHSDTHYEPLMLAYNVAVNGGDPFVQVTTEGRRSSLKLQPEIREFQSSNYEHLYIYEA